MPVTAPPSSPWWQDWPKFVPGWLAFLATTYSLARTGLTRFHRRALGPDDTVVREQLVLARAHFQDITSAGGRREKWFMADDRKRTAQSLRDLAERRRNKRLKIAIQRVADAWDEASSLAPPDRILMSLAGKEMTPEERSRQAADREQLGRQADVARRGIERVAESLSRLNRLEQRTIGW
ncbi:hypothetical protein GCM10022403_076940 [Streptomyces coacervatus]|uniref:Uncharacterized protein n=1 Tax=Streptomyces coacervatus TaxID=647381 RepID=A0ABP7J1L3_9ACTN